MPERYEEFLHPRLRLFLSADIVGSTAHKQNVIVLTDEYVKRNQAEQHLLKKFEHLAPPWLSPITKFYHEIDRIFSLRWRTYHNHTAEQIGWPTGETPVLWKAVGDEIIYTKVLGDHREAFACVQIWCDSVRTYRKTLQKEFPSLDIKATGWLAGFPLSNAEVIIRNQVGVVDEFDSGDDVFYNFWLLEKYYSSDDSAKKGLTIDFVGPSIDIGFRLGSLSTPRKFVISLDLALLLAYAIPPQRAGFNKLLLRYDERIELRGVLGGRPYPIFWLDLLHDDDVLSAEDKLQRPGSLVNEDIWEFCERFLVEHEQYMIRPFIEGDKDHNFRTIPLIYAERLKKLSDGWPDAKRQKEIEVRAIRGEEGPPVPPGIQAIGEDAVSSFEIPTSSESESRDEKSGPRAE